MEETGNGRTRVNAYAHNEESAIIITPKCPASLLREIDSTIRHIAGASPDDL